MTGRFFQQVKHLHRVAAGAAGDEEVEEQSDHHECEDARPGEMDILHAKQKLPADRGAEFDDAVKREAEEQPERSRVCERLDHRGALRVIAEDEPEDASGDDELQARQERAPHSPNLSIHFPRASTISSTVRRGLISNTKSVSFGRSARSES